MNPIFPDTRPYPTDPIKSDVLLYATQSAHEKGATQKLAHENLLGNIAQQFFERNTLGLSVAMSMSPDVKTYRALMDATAHTLNAQNHSEIQWLALPVILVSGSTESHTLSLDAPIDALKNLFSQHAHLHALSKAQWLPQLMCADDFAAIKPKDWYDAKHNHAAAEQLAQRLPQRALTLPAESAVNVLYAVAYGDSSLQAALNVDLRDAAMPLMNIWQTHLAQPNLTLFANPLSPDNPTHALTKARFTRLRMALDVFAANAIRAIRLKNEPVAVVMAAREGGELLFGFQAEKHADWPSFTFTWALSPHDSIANIQQNFLDLMIDCQIEQAFLLHAPLGENAELPHYSQTSQHTGHNPLSNILQAA